MFKILSTYICWKMYKMQHLEGSGTPVLYIGRTVFKDWKTFLKKIKTSVYSVTPPPPSENQAPYQIMWEETVVADRRQSQQ
jgi:hypothetical protein